MPASLSRVNTEKVVQHEVGGPCFFCFTSYIFVPSFSICKMELVIIDSFYLLGSLQEVCAKVRY